MSLPAGRLAAALARGPVLLDSAHGTRLIARGLDLARDDACLWNLDRPHEVAALHAADVAAGAEALLTNTFVANRAWLDRVGRGSDAARANREGVALARTAAGLCRPVLGSIGPVRAGHEGAILDQAEALLDAGVDAILLETQLTGQAAVVLAMLRPALDAAGVPALVSVCDAMNSVDDVARRLTDLGAAAVGVNCVPGMPMAQDLLAGLRRGTDLPLLAKPNAGPPGVEPIAPAAFAAAVPELLALGVALVGGCCGTTPEHVAALRRALDAAMPPGRAAGDTTRRTLA